MSNKGLGVKKTQTPPCYHCGDECRGTVLFYDEKQFCCEGCKSVYALLSENGLCDYYQLNQVPGQSLKDSGDKRFEFLDDPAVQEKLIRYSDEAVSVVVLSVPEIHCSSCIYLLENLYRIAPEIRQCRVNFLKREVQLSFDKQKMSLRQVAELLTRIGYEPRFNLNDLEGEVPQFSFRPYYLKIGIAFFCFGNMMLFSFPEYLGLDVLADSSFRRFFGYLNFALSLPIMFYSAAEFFRSAWLALRQRTLNMDVPIVLGILAMFIQSTLEVFLQTGSGYFDTLGSLVLLMLIGRLFQNRTYAALSFERDYKSYFPVAVSCIQENGETHSVPLNKLKPGDKIQVRNGELIPADSILLSGTAAIDYSFVTGESVPVQVGLTQLIYAGGRQTAGSIVLMVKKEVSQSYLTRLWNNSAFGKGSHRALSSMAEKASRWFTPLILVIALIAAIYWFPIDPVRAAHAFSSVLIITCPCALALSSPFTLGNVLRILSRKGIYLKSAKVIEEMAALDTVVFDKTGTITSGKNAAVEYDEFHAHEMALSYAKSLAHQSQHPISRQIEQALHGVAGLNPESCREVPGKGVEAWMDDHHLRLGSASFVGLTDQEETETGSWLSMDGQILGRFRILTSLRPGFEEVAKQLQPDYQLGLLSGDHPHQRNFFGRFFAADAMWFSQLPAQKLEHIADLQKQGKRVAMVGDGLNDAGALQQSDVGIAISENINNFSPACDAIMDAVAFDRLPQLLKLSKDAVWVITGSFILSLLYNVVGIAFAVQGNLSPLVAAILMPLSSVTIIVFTTLGSGWAAKRRGF